MTHSILYELIDVFNLFINKLNYFLNPYFEEINKYQFKNPSIPIIFKKILKNHLETLNIFENFFTKIEKMDPIRSFYDQEKLCFYINFFNFILLYKLFFQYIAKKDNLFPYTPQKWIKFLDETKFIIFKEKYSLLTFEVSVIR